MSQNPYSAFEQPRSLSIGLAIAGLVCAIVGVCVPGIGLIGLILGIVAMVKASSSPQTHGGKGLALAAIIVGAISIFTSIIITSFSVGLLLPALGKARDAARQTVAHANLRQIGVSLEMYSNDNKGWFPEQGADVQARLSKYGTTSRMFESPRAGPGATDAFIYIPGTHTPFEADTIVMYENPKYVPHGTVSVLRADGMVMPVPVSNLGATLQAAPKPGAPVPPPPPKRRGSGS